MRLIVNFATARPRARIAATLICLFLGGHAFAETYDQHQKNVARLRLIETDQKDQVPLDQQMISAPAPAPATAPATPAPSTAPQPPPLLRGTSQPRAQTTH